MRRSGVLVRSWWRSNIPVDAAGRRFIIAALIDNFGGGARSTIFPLFLVLIAGLPAVQVGLGLAIVGAMGLVAAAPVGQLCDRLGPKLMLTVGCSLQAVVALSLIFIHSLLTFCVLMSVGRIGTQATRVGRLSLVARAVPERRNVLRAQMNVFINIGVALGLGLSAIVLSVGSRWAYLAAFAFDAATFLVAALIQRGIKVNELVTGEPSVAVGRSSPWCSIFADRRYAVVVAMNGVLFFHQNILVLGIPLWIASTNRVPHIVTTGIFLLNLVVTILFQVKVSRAVTSLDTAARSWRRSGIYVAIACAVLYVATEVRLMVLGVLFALVAGSFLTLGELWYSASEQEISTGLAPAAQRGLYQGVFTIGRDLAQTVGPLAAALLCVTIAPFGWAILVGVYVLFAASASRILQWAQASRPAVRPIQAQGSR